MKQSFRLTLFLLLVSLSTQAQKDCCTSLDIVSGVTTLVFETSGSGKVDDVSCSCLGAEGGSAWFAFTATSNGTFEIIIEPTAQPAPNFDFALWQGVCPCGSGGAQPPLDAIVCNNISGTGPTGIATRPDVSFGVTPTNQFSETVNLFAGTNYYLLVSNVADNGAGFYITTAGTANITTLILDDFDLTIDGPSTVCDGGEAVFTATSQPSQLPTYYGWEILQTGYKIATGTTPEVSLEFPGPGTYDVCVYVANGVLGCFGSQPVCTTIDVNSIPYPAGVESAYVCTNDVYVAPSGEAFYFGGTFDVHYLS